MSLFCTFSLAYMLSWFYLQKRHPGVTDERNNQVQNIALHILPSVQYFNASFLFDEPSANHPYRLHATWNSVGHSPNRPYANACAIFIRTVSPSSVLKWQHLCKAGTIPTMDMCKGPCSQSHFHIRTPCHGQTPMHSLTDGEANDVSQQQGSQGATADESWAVIPCKQLC